MGDASTAIAATDNGDAEDLSVPEWEIGLPSDADLTPLSLSLVPPALAAAFSITPEPPRTMREVQRASHNTITALRRNTPGAPAALKSFLPDSAAANDDGNAMVFEPDNPGSPSRNSRRPDPQEAESSAHPDNSGDDPSARTLKRPRLVWTPQLHKRFVEVVAHLGIKTAVPKSIMQLMNVEGLTRENVASHLQKYRLYLKRMQGLSTEGPSSSDHLFASTPVPPSLHEAVAVPPPPHPHPLPMPFPVPAMIPMQVFNMGHQLGMVPANSHQGSPGSFHGFESHYQHGTYADRHNDWSGGGNYRSIASYPRVAPSDK